MNLLEVCRLIDDALIEDLGCGDVTSELVVPPDAKAEGTIISREKGVAAGIPVAGLCFRRLDSRVSFVQVVEDGSRISRKQILARLSGPAVPMLQAERVALNFIQRLSGIATLTAKFAEAVKDYSVKILDTRKTTPGLRILEKYAVRMGGGFNHRMGLYDGILIKDNHLMFQAPGPGEADRKHAPISAVAAAVAAARMAAGHLQKIEIEAETSEQVEEAVRAGADVILLDNMDVQTLSEAVGIVRRSKKKILLEASGNVTIRNVAKIAATGVDAISIGALTHSVPALDISLKMRCT